jgi:hypothetical protein
VIEPPNDSKVEAAAALLKGAVSAIPFVGGVVAEVGNLYLNPLERRKQRWTVEVSLALNAIQDRFALLPEDLSKNEAFISFLYQATISALKTHQAEKLVALRNGLVASLNETRLSQDLSFQFLRFIDELSVSHLSILRMLEKHRERFVGLGDLQQVHQTLNGLLDVPLEAGAFRSFLQDLDNRFLIRVEDLEDLPDYASKKSTMLREESETRWLAVTPLGSAFLAFIRGD